MNVVKCVRFTNAMLIQKHSQSINFNKLLAYFVGNYLTLMTFFAIFQMSNFMNQIAFKRGWNKVFVRARIRSIIIVLSELEDCLGRLRIKISLDFSLDSTLQSKYALPKKISYF